MENIFVEFLPPWIETGLQPAFYDKESGTVLQQTARMYARVNMLIRMFNKLSKNTKTTVEDYINQFNELHDYVHDYFDNLDVQEEINNKLDAMVEDGTLQEILGEYFTIIDGFKNKVKYIFPKFISGRKSSDYSLITYKDNVIMIDSSSSSYWADVEDMLEDNSISKIDVFILSHYDPDHVGNLENLVTNDYITSDSIVYLPAVPSRYPAMQTVETNIKNMLSSNNISYTTPSENQTINVEDDLNIKFGNVTKSYMESNYTNYNYCSMVCLVTFKETSAFYAGDAGSPTYMYLYNNDFVPFTVDLYKQGHHGIDVANNEGYRLQDSIKPKITVQCGGYEDYAIGNFLCEETAFLVKGGTDYYPTCIQDNYLTFESTGYDMICTNGVCRNVSPQGISINLYVDVNTATSSVQDGTSANPFSSLSQALGYIHNFPQGIVNIYLADGEYCINNEWPANHAKNKLFICQGKGTKIRIVGNGNDDTAVKIHLADIRYSDVTLEHVTINNDDGIGVNLISSKLFLYSCIIEPKTGTSTYDGIQADFSNVLLRKTQINNSNHIITAINGSIVKLGDDLSFTGNTNSYPLAIVRSTLEPVNIFSSFDADTHTATTSLPLSLFDYVEIEYDSGAGGYNYGLDHMRTATNSRGSMFSTHTSAGGTIYNRQANSVVTDSTHITIENERQLTVSATPGNPTSTDITGSFSITKIYAYKNI